MPRETHRHQLTRLIDDDDDNFGNQRGGTIGKPRDNRWCLPCQRFGKSLQRVSQRDILTPSSQNHFPFDFLARKTRSYLGCAL